MVNGTGIEKEIKQILTKRQIIEKIVNINRVSAGYHMITNV